MLRRAHPRPDAPDWDALMTGHARRLRSGRHFEGSVQTFVRAAHVAAADRGRILRTARDKVYPDKCVWVQFAAGPITEGEPCQCGGRVLRRIHPNFVRCETCSLELIIEPKRRLPEPKPPRPAKPAKPVEPVNAPPPETPTPAAKGPRALPRKTLNGYSFVRLTCYEEAPEGIRYVGEAVDPDGVPVMLVVIELRAGNEPIPDPRSPTGKAHKVLASIPKRDLGGIDLDDPPKPDHWDLVID